MDNSQKGTIIKGPNWPEPVEIKLIEDAGGYVHIVGATKNSRQHIDQLISKEEFAHFKLDQFTANFGEEAWKVFLALENTRYRFPEDVADQNLGFDIRSRDPKTNDIRYIEVKARSTTAAVALTQNEWFKAKQFKEEYYLYAVMNATTDPKLYIIQNPAENLAAEEKIEVVRYVIPLKQIQEKGKLHDEKN